MRQKIFFILPILLLLALPTSLAAHFIVGTVNPAKDGTSPNGETVVLWNPANGIDDNITDIIGATGNSGADNIYLMDCELLSTPCAVNDELRVRVINTGNNYASEYTNTTVTGLGFDLMPNITLNSPPNITNISVDDSLTIPAGEIDLTPATTTQVLCEGVIFDHDGNSSLQNVTAEIFDNTASAYGSSDDNNNHYTNNSCSFDLGYGNANETSFSCGFEVEYYANSGNWNCTAQAIDNVTISDIDSNLSNINTLLALSVPSPIDFGEVNATAVGPETIINVTNMGNVGINLSLSGYAHSEFDGNALNCTQGELQNISIENKKYNLTASNPSDLTFTQVNEFYKNLTSDVTINSFNLNQRQNDLTNDAINQTYWRIYVPLGVAGTCTGNIVFGAVQNQET